MAMLRLDVDVGSAVLGSPHRERAVVSGRVVVLEHRVEAPCGQRVVEVLVCHEEEVVRVRSIADRDVRGVCRVLRARSVGRCRVPVLRVVVERYDNIGALEAGLREDVLGQWADGVGAGGRDRRLRARRESPLEAGGSKYPVWVGPARATVPDLEGSVPLSRMLELHDHASRLRRDLEGGLDGRPLVVVQVDGPERARRAARPDDGVRHDRDLEVADGHHHGIRLRCACGPRVSLEVDAVGSGDGRVGTALAVGVDLEGGGLVGCRLGAGGRREDQEAEGEAHGESRAGRNVKIVHRRARPRGRRWAIQVDVEVGQKEGGPAEASPPIPTSRTHPPRGRLQNELEGEWEQVEQSHDVGDRVEAVLEREFADELCHPNRDLANERNRVDQQDAKHVEQHVTERDGESRERGLLPAGDCHGRRKQARRRRTDVRAQHIRKHLSDRQDAGADERNHQAGGHRRRLNQERQHQAEEHCLERAAEHVLVKRAPTAAEHQRLQDHDEVAKCRKQQRDPDQCG